MCGPGCRRTDSDSDSVAGSQAQSVDVGPASWRAHSPSAEADAYSYSHTVHPALYSTRYCRLSSPRPGSPPPCVWGAAKSYAPVIDQASVYAAPDRYLEQSPLERRQIHSQIERSSSHGHRTMEDSPAQSLAALSGSAKDQPSPSEHRLARPRCTWSCWEHSQRGGTCSHRLGRGIAGRTAAFRNFC